MAIPSSIHNNKGPLPPTKQPAVDRHGIQSISPPPSSQSTDGSSPPRRGGPVAKSRSQRIGDRTKNKNAPTAHEEPARVTLRGKHAKVSLSGPHHTVGAIID